MKITALDTLLTDDGLPQKPLVPNSKRRDGAVEGKTNAVNHTAPPILPPEGFLRLTQIIGDEDADPPIPAVIPISKSSWWAGVKSGKYPKSVKLGPRTTAWRVSDIRALIAAA